MEIRMRAGALIAWLVCLGVGGWLFHPAGIEQSALQIWLGAAVLLELTAPRLGSFTFLTTAPALALALGARSASAALVVLWIPLILRTLLRGNSRPAGRALEALCDLLPASVALALEALTHRPEPGAVAFALVWTTMPGLVAGCLDRDSATEWARYRSAVTFAGCTPAWASLLLLALPPDSMVAFGVTVLLLLEISRLGATAVGVVDSRAQKLGVRELNRELSFQREGLDLREDQLAHTGREQRKTSVDLQVRLETYTMVEQMIAALPGQAPGELVAKGVVDKVRLRVPVQTVALFWPKGSELEALAYRTPHGERIKAAALMHSREPVMERAVRMGRLERSQDDDRHAQRIFPDEVGTAAVPMRGRGVLYLGHPRPFDLSEDQLHFLNVIANHAVLALEAAESFQATQQSLQREAEAASRNVGLVQRLALIIDTVTQLVKLNQPQEMLEATGGYLERIVPHDYRYLVSGDHVSHAGKEGIEAAYRTVTEVVQQNGVPLLLEDFKNSRFLPPTARTKTLLCVPLLIDQGAMGAMLVGREQGAAFTREDQDILAVLAYQLGAALHTASLFQELDETHQALKESQAQLVQSSKMAAIGQLAGGVAHELNTPLGAISLAIDGALSVLKTKPDRAESRLTRAAGSVQQMKQIVSKLLFYSRDARTGRRETDLSQVIEDTLQLIGHQLMMDSVAVEKRLDPDVTLVANQNELQQIFTNLALNARDAVLSEGATARKILVTTRDDGESVIATVRDWGCGMTEAVRERIFEPFYTTKEVGKGTGLGLSVTMQLLESHGGTIAVESSPGNGTEFTVRLPKEGGETDE